MVVIILVTVVILLLLSLFLKSKQLTSFLTQTKSWQLFSLRCFWCRSQADGATSFLNIADCYGRGKSDVVNDLLASKACARE